jgi:hypothetical protein
MRSFVERSAALSGIGALILMLAACGGSSDVGVESNADGTSTVKPSQPPPTKAQCAPDLHCAP